MSTLLQPNMIRDVTERMEVEILADMREGVVPSTCRDFGDLHDYVDANMYADDLMKKHGVGDENWLELANSVQGIVHQWLVTRESTAGLGGER